MLEREEYLKEDKIIENQHREENKMGIMPIRPLLLSMAWPAIISMTINALYNVVDSFFVAKVSEDALTAVSLIHPLQMMIVAVGVGTGVGVNSLISRSLGAKNQITADKAATSGLVLGIFDWIIFLVLGLTIPKLFVGAYAEEGTYIYEAAIQYLMVVFVGSLFTHVEIIIEKILQATGNMKAPMICSLCGAITNVILDPILIFGLLGAPSMGVIGAAIATVIGQFVSFVVATTILVRGEHLVDVNIRHFSFDGKVIKDIYAVGVPSIVMQSITSVMNVAFNAILVTYSSTAVAVLGVYFKLQSFIFLPVFGLNQGALPIIGYNFGAKNPDRLKETRVESIKVALIVMVFGVVLFQTIPGALLSIFSASDEMLRLGIPALRIISINFIPAAFGIMNGTVFQGTGHGVYSLFTSIVRQLVGTVPFAYILAKIGGVTLSWFAFPIGEVLGLILSFALLNNLYKKEINNLRRKNINIG